MKAVILAAGTSSRFWPLAQNKHKTMYLVGPGRPILYYTLQGLKESGIEEVILVVAPGLAGQTIQNYFGSTGADLGLKIVYVEQTEPLGMGDGLKRAAPFLRSAGVQNFLLVNASQINIGQILKHGQRAIKLISGRIILFGQPAPADDLKNFGVIQVVGNHVVNLVEKPAVLPPNSLRLLGIYCLPLWFLDILEKIHGPLALEDALRSAIFRQTGVWAQVLPENFPSFSLKFPWDLLTLNHFLLTSGEFKEQAVILKGKVDIHPSALIEGPIVIEEGVKIMEFASLKGPICLSQRVVIGSYAQVRGPVFVGEKVTIGARSEVKNSILYQNTTLHDNYVGDSVLDEGVNLGAGTVTANLNFKRNGLPSFVKSTVKGCRTNSGQRKLGAIIGTGTQLGINVSLLPGIKIGPGAKVFPGAVVTEDILGSQFYGHPATGTARVQN